MLRTASLTLKWRLKCHEEGEKRKTASDKRKTASDKRKTTSTCKGDPAGKRARADDDDGNGSFRSSARGSWAGEWQRRSRQNLTARRECTGC